MFIFLDACLRCQSENKQDDCVGELHLFDINI